jgi:hypothetical protein
MRMLKCNAVMRRESREATRSYVDIGSFYNGKCRSSSGLSGGRDESPRWQQARRLDRNFPCAIRSRSILKLLNERRTKVSFALLLAIALVAPLDVSRDSIFVVPGRRKLTSVRHSLVVCSFLFILYADAVFSDIADRIHIFSSCSEPRISWSNIRRESAASARSLLSKPSVITSRTGCSIWWDKGPTTETNLFQIRKPFTWISIVDFWMRAQMGSHACCSGAGPML